MTDLQPSDRALKALKAGGMHESPLASLERDDALFVLTDSTLVYQDGGGTRRVTLRDLTRIHSDQDGLLRVETPAGTALTASLVGFDAQQVQSFFGRVRSTTFSAKQIPAPPVTGAGGEKTFGPAGQPAQPAQKDGPPPTFSASATGVTGSKGTPPQPAERQETPSPAAPQAAGAELKGQAPSAPFIPPISSRPEASQPALPKAPETTPAPVREAAEIIPPPARPAPLTPEPVVISSSAFSSSARPAPAPPRSTPPATAPEKAASATTREQEEDTPPAVTLPPLLEAPSLARRAPTSTLTSLAAQANVASGLVGRLLVLGALLFVGSVVLAYFQFMGDQRLSALWTLLAGGVGSIALMTLADMIRLLVAVGRALSAEGGVMDAD